jgi:hypothetical protein
VLQALIFWLKSGRRSDFSRKRRRLGGGCPLRILELA